MIFLFLALELLKTMYTKMANLKGRSNWEILENWYYLDDFHDLIVKLKIVRLLRIIHFIMVALLEPLRLSVLKSFLWRTNYF